MAYAHKMNDDSGDCGSNSDEVELIKKKNQPDQPAFFAWQSFKRLHTTQS
jgi:hypothetical protein